MVLTIEGTTGWSTSSGELAASLGRCGVKARVVGTGPVAEVRTLALTDLTQALAVRRAGRDAIASERPRAIIYCSITAALLWPQRGAIWLDATAAENRPGRHGVWQRPLERRRLAEAPLVMTMSDRALALRPVSAATRGTPVAEVPVPVEASGPAAAQGRDIAALAYAGNPEKKQLDLVLRVWATVRGPGEILVVAGAAPPSEPPEGVRFTGTLPREEYRALLRRARVFVAAPRFEDYGTAQLEALADGCPARHPARAGTVSGP